MRHPCFNLAVLLSALSALAACVDDTEPFVHSSTTDIPATEGTPFLLLNEGNMGSNKASLDYCVPEQGLYQLDIFQEYNPSIAGNLGDVGNDIQSYGNKVYIVVNCSNLVEVIDKSSFAHVGQVAIPNCRYVAFAGEYAYVSSYAGPVSIDPNARRGLVLKVDTASLQVVDSVLVGYQPEEIAIIGDRLFVANSGGYRVPNYDNTVSVIDLPTFTLRDTIEVGINLHRLRHYGGSLYLTSRGDYYDTPPNFYRLSPDTYRVDTLDIPVSEFDIKDSVLYYYTTSWSYLTNSNTIDYGKLDLVSGVRSGFSSPATSQISIPYGIRVDPGHDILYLTDAKTYVIPGTVYALSLDGTLLWSTTTGDIPAHFCFL